MNRNVVAPTTVEHNQESPTSAAPALQPHRCSPNPAVQPRRCSPVSAAPVVQPHRCSPVSAAPSSVPRNDTPCCPHSELVIFLSVLQC